MAHSRNATLTMLALLGGCAHDAGFEPPTMQVPQAFGWYQYNSENKAELTFHLPLRHK